jgi:hypothetical protein
MAFKKNTGNQILFILTKSGDGSHAKGATVSQVTAGGASYVLVSNGSAAVASKGTISRAASLVKSGVFRQSLKAAECNGDMALYMFTATSCALQLIPVTFEANTPGETYSRVLLNGSLASDAHSQCVLATSAARQAASRALVIQSLASDAQSMAQQTYSRVMLTASLASDAHSQAVLATSAARQVNSRALIVQSLASDTHSQCVLAVSAARQGNSRALLIQSLASDAVSAARAVVVTIGASDISAIASTVASAVLAAGVGGDNASRIWAYSDAAATKSAAEQANARALVIQSLASDAESQAQRSYSAVQLATSAARQGVSRALIVQSLASDAHSQALRVYSAVAAGAGGATPSEVWAYPNAAAVLSAAQEANSRVLVVQSAASDAVALGVLSTSAARQAAARALVIQSLASDTHSQAARTYSAVAAGAGGATPSEVWAYSDAAAVLSAARKGSSRVLTVQSLASDAQSVAAAAYSRCVLATSAARQGSSRALVVQSLVSDTHSAAIQGLSRALSIQSLVSDVHSLVQDVPTADENADKLLGRNIAGASDGGRTVTGALRTVRNKIDTVTVPGYAIIYREDDLTEDHRRALATDASALPIVTSDPTT